MNSSELKLQQFREVQKIAYDCVKYAQYNLKEGMSEKDICEIMKIFFKSREVNDFFHMPFAWFGERTAFSDFHRPLSISNILPHFGKEFMPTNKKIKDGMCVILDVAPIIYNKVVDVGYSFSFGENLEVTEAKRDLIKFRNLILDGVRSERLMSEIYEECNSLLDNLGYENGHSYYPLGVLGHLVGDIPSNKFPKISIRGFQLNAYSFLIKNQINGLLRRDETYGIWNSESHMKISNGLWAVEPHIVKNGFGVKFEEILVVDSNGYNWLSQDLPHLNI